MDITGLTPALKAFDYMRALLKDPLKFANLARTLIDPCDPSQPIEICIDDICHQNGEQIPNKLTKGARNFLNNQVQGLMKSPTFLKLFGSPGAVMRAFLEGQSGSLCKPNNVAEMEAFAKQTIAATVPAPHTNDEAEPAKFEITTTVEDMGRAGVITAGVKLIYDMVMFGATAYPPARPAAQGIMMLLFGIKPMGIENESPRDRMIREGA